MDWLQNINFEHHDGVNLPMINDFMRNQFYDRVLGQHVRNQHCTDIGFGTGLLTIMALKHGASHVRAFECDENRYLLGCEIIARLGLAKQVELIFDRYTAKTCKPTPITFTETVNGNLWWEGLWDSLPAEQETRFIPGTYFLEIWAMPVPVTFAQGLCRSGQTQTYFSPGVDIDPQFVDLVDELAGRAPAPEPVDLPTGIVRFERQQETDWGWIPYMRAVQAGTVVASYYCNSRKDDRTRFELIVDTKAWKNHTVLLVPRMGMQQDHDRLYLDTGHWGPGENPVLLVNPQSALQINHNVYTGQINYILE